MSALKFSLAHGYKLYFVSRLIEIHFLEEMVQKKFYSQDAKQRRLESSLIPQVQMLLRARIKLLPTETGRAF